MAEFKREERYIVLKLQDIHKYLPVQARTRLGEICNLINWHRNEDGKTPIEAVVVEHDWEEYEYVWDLIKQRMERKPWLS